MTAAPTTTAPDKEPNEGPDGGTGTGPGEGPDSGRGGGPDTGRDAGTDAGPDDGPGGPRRKGRAAPEPAPYEDAFDHDTLPAPRARPRRCCARCSPRSGRGSP